MNLVLRALALLGSPARAVDRLLRGVMPFLPGRVPGGLVVAVALGAAAWSTASATTEAIAARPGPVEASIGDLVDGSASTWVTVSGLLSGPHVDNGIYASDRGAHFVRISDDPHDHVDEGGGEPVLEPGPRQTIFRLTQGDGVTRWFYVLRAAGDDGRAIVVRSARGEDEMRLRSIVVRAAGELDGLPHLVEVADARADGADATLGGVPDDAPATIRGSFGEAERMRCDGDDTCREGWTWRYLVSDAAEPDARAWIDSPHPPDGLPVTLSGVVTTDATRMRAVLATTEMGAALEGLRHPDDLVLADGAGPLFPEASYLGAIVLAVVALFLAASALVRYPVFRPIGRGAGQQVRRPVVEELIEVEVSGTLPAVNGGGLARAPAHLGWLPARELARRAWHLRMPVPDAADERPRLALLAVEGGFAMTLDAIRDRLHVERGLLATNTAVQAGLRLAGPDLQVTLGFASAHDRDRVARELDADTGAPTTGPLPVVAHRPAPAVRGWAGPATALALGAVGALLVATAVAGVLSGIADLPALAGAGLAALLLGTMAIGLARRHPLAVELLPSVALLGLVVGVVASLATAGCGTWLTPDMDGCATLDAGALVPPLALVAASLLSLWAAPQLAARRSA